MSDFTTWGLNLVICKMEKLEGHVREWVLIHVPQSPKSEDTLGILHTCE